MQTTTSMKTLLLGATAVACALMMTVAPVFVNAYQPMNGVMVSPVAEDPTTYVTPVDVGKWLKSGGGGGGDDGNEGSAVMPGKSLLVFGTYAADFNAIEYGQRLRYYWPILQEEKGFSRCAMLLNCQPAAAKVLSNEVDLPDSIELWVDNTGQAGRAFGVGRGFLPDNDEVNPFLKLFAMLWGLGAWGTLPAVIGGYIGNPYIPQPWIEDALAVGQIQGRWPDNALELTPDGRISTNKFKDLPGVGTWERPPLELATLRLQNMIGISLSKWKELAPDQDALDAGILTQLGGCLVVDEAGNPLYEWRDPGICAVANFEDILKKV